MDFDRGPVDRMAGLVLHDAADRGARLEPQLLEWRQFQRVSLVVQKMWIGTSLGLLAVNHRLWTVAPGAHSIVAVPSSPVMTVANWDFSPKRPR